MSGKKEYDIGYDPTPLSPKQERAALLLAEGETGAYVAKHLKVTPQTIVEWKKKHLFQVAFNRHRKDFVDSARESIRRGIHRASATVVALLDDDDPKIQLQAAKTLLDKVEPPEMSGWGIGEVTVEKLIEAEYRKANPVSELLSYGGVYTDGMAEQIAAKIQEADAHWEAAWNDADKAEPDK